MSSLKREEIVRLERAHVWPPYTSSERHEGQEPLVVARADGIFIEDEDGRRLVDASASWWTCALGHGHPRLRAALTRQAEALMHVSSGGITHRPVATLAARLAEVTPGDLSRVHFSDDGSTAVEAAVKIAFQFHQQNGRPERTRFIALGGAYHGDTLGVASLAAVDEFAAVFGPLLFEVIRPPNPKDPAGWEAAVDYIEAQLRDRSKEIAGVVVEPLVQGASGMRMYPPALLQRLRAATEAAETLLIADEVFTGYGRTGAMWACERADVVPDLLATAKGFTGGVLPMAATVARPFLYDGFRGGAERALLHGHTFCGNPLGAAVALEVLQIFEDDGVLAHVRALEPRLAAHVERLGALEGVHRPRHLGLIGAVDLSDAGYHGGLGWEVYAHALELGVFLRPLGDTVYVTPPLTITADELDDLMARVEEALRRALP
jgi:adenosylmethionine-8-amino-7-oxononanoate aminotransferase